MLFDLQTPRRRRVVRVVFGGLALIFAISFVFLGVGTGGGGFSFSDLFGGGGGGSSASAFEDDINAAQEKLQADPQDTVALGALVTLHYQAANSETDSNGNLSSDGAQHLREAVDAWNKYLTATNGQPERGPTLIAIQAFSVLAQVDFSDVGQASTASEQLQSLHALQTDLTGVAEAYLKLAARQPTFTNYANAAQYFYLAGKDQEAQAAVAKAQDHAKGNQGTQLVSQLKPVQARGAQFTQAIDQLTKQQQSASAATGGGGTPLGGLSGAGGLGGVGTGGP